MRTFSGQEYVLADDEAERVIQVKNEPNIKAFIALRNGAHVDKAAIESVGPVPLVPMRNGYVVNKLGFYVQDGNRIHVEDWGLVKYAPDPKYAAMAAAEKIGALGSGAKGLPEGAGSMTM